MIGFLERQSIAKILVASFGAVLTAIILFGWFVATELNVLAVLTEKLYRHPYAVSTNLRDIQTGIVSMHRSMKDVALAKNEEQLLKAAETVDQVEAADAGAFRSGRRAVPRQSENG